MTKNPISSEASEAMAWLDRLRDKHGASSDIGFICSNYIEQIKSLQKEDEPAARANLTTAIALSQEHLARLIKGEG